jgi:hypothetical protein
MAQDQSARDSEGYGAGELAMRGRLRVPEWESSLGGPSLLLLWGFVAN